MKTRFRRTVKEIYLHKEGDVIEIRKLKKDDTSRILLIPNLNTSKYDNDQIYKRGDEFPEEYPSPKGRTTHVHWRKYFHGNNEWIELPKYYEYMNEEVLVAALSGKVIDTGEKYIKKVNYHLKERVDMNLKQSETRDDAE